jgi:hypothetical protein
MAGQIIISNIKTDSDNAFSILANTGAVLFSANLASGITTGIADGSVTNAKLAGSITGDKIGQSAISSNNIVSVDGSTVTSASITPAKLSQPFTSGTAVTPSAVTFTDFTGIPSWVKRITVVFNEVSTNGTSGTLIQLGTSGGVVSSGYLSTSVGTAVSAGVSNYTAGFGIRNDSASYVMSGHMVITSIGGNIWISSHTTKVSTAVCPVGGGSVTLGGTLNQIRFITSNNTDTFDAGSINILYE